MYAIPLIAYGTISLVSHREVRRIVIIVLIKSPTCPRANLVKHTRVMGVTNVMQRSPIAEMTDNSTTTKKVCCRTTATEV